MNWTWPVGVVAAGVLAFSLTRLVLWWLERRGMLDVPNVRSSHTVPTPRGGGIALVAAITVAWTWGAAMGTAAATATAIVLGLGLGLAALSFRDDVRALPVLIRLGGQIAVVAVGTAALPADGLVFQGLLPLVADRALAALVWLWFVNLYNFMDGIDGITGIETFSIGVGLFLAMTLAAGPGDVAYGGLCTAAAAVGFLWWNRHPARIFLGDVGSIPLGFWVGWLLLSAAAVGHWVPALLLPLYYLADATLTLMRRAFAGEAVWRAHAGHFYQHAARALGRHDSVTRVILVVNLGLIALAALNAVISPLSVVWLIGGAALTLGLLWYFATRKPVTAPPAPGHA